MGWRSGEGELKVDVSCGGSFVGSWGSQAGGKETEVCSQGWSWDLGE